METFTKWTPEQKAAFILEKLNKEFYLGYLDNDTPEDHEIFSAFEINENGFKVQWNQFYGSSLNNDLSFKKEDFYDDRDYFNFEVEHAYSEYRGRKRKVFSFKNRVKTSGWGNSGNAYVEFAITFNN
ncbi:MAG: hypothetical protein GY775_19465 [Candidatus Scalindua sp.]|nr:hypothetical protein [Candidatus Scalindua sp.]